MTKSTVPQWTLSDRLRKAREHAGFEQGDLAERMGVSRNTVSNYERGFTAPRTVAIGAWSLATGVDREWLEHGEIKRGASDDVLDDVDRAVGVLEQLLRARRDSNPQPSDPESGDWYCEPCGLWFVDDLSYAIHLDEVHGPDDRALASRVSWAVAA